MYYKKTKCKCVAPVTRIPVCEDILEENHILIAGTTGSGKSVFLNSILYDMISHSEYRFCAIDLKRVELSPWKTAKQCNAYADTITDALDALDCVIDLMEKRFKFMEEEGLRVFPGTHYFVVIDELADLISTGKKPIVERLTKIGRLGRAARIHLLMCTQSPNRKVLVADIMQNITCAVALRCRSAIESRQIVGVKGAELLPKYGKGILWNSDGISNIDIPMVSDEDVNRQMDAWIDA